MKQRNTFSGALLLSLGVASLCACGDARPVTGDGQSLSSATGVPGATGVPACADTSPPVAEPHTLQLWPPNHKFHTISVDDCVSFVDACNGPLTGEFIWASSDEPVDDKGDGHFAPDIEIADCDQVAVRAERAGPKNGRVYKLGVRVVDAHGHASESECSVIVDHDQRGVQGADSGESYRIKLDGSLGGPTCDGVVTPVVPPAVDAGAPVPVTDTDAGSAPPPVCDRDGCVVY